MVQSKNNPNFERNQCKRIMNRNIAIFSILILLSAIAAALYVFVPEVQIGVARFTEDGFEESNVYSDTESLSARLQEEIQNGSDAFTVYLKDMDVEAINQINESLDGIFGSGESYAVSGNIGKTYEKVTITIKHSDNYYALQAYLNDKPIPDTNPKAKELYAVVKQILDHEITAGMSDYEKELALHDYLTTHCIYSEDTAQPPESDIYRAYGALVNQDAVYNGYAEALQLLFACVGIESKFVVGTADGVDHAWNLVKIDDKWYHLDSTWDDPLPDQGPKVLHAYFNVTDEIMEETHTWNKEDYPAAYSMDANFYKVQGSYYKDFDTYSQGTYDIMVNDGTSRYEAVVEGYAGNRKDMQFLFDGNYRYNSVNWQTFQAGSYCVLVLEAQ